jgi:tetrapyrrole methylase family protein/MazG family protein
LDEQTAETQFAEYMGIIRRLRKECPWDREQTHESLRTHLIEEAYEVVEAVTQDDRAHLRNELGDLFLHIALQSAIAEEEGSFTIADVLASSRDKMIRRHPHIFGDTKVNHEGDVRKNWEAIKRQEGKTSILDGVPDELPALIRAQRTQEKASIAGFDWKNKDDVWKKVEEELEELRHAEKNGNEDAVGEEFGDLLFALVNYSRFIGVTPEFVLRASVNKFGKRFKFIEEQLQRRGKTPAQSSLEEMDALWDEAKKKD